MLAPSWRHIPKSHSSSILEADSAASRGGWTKNQPLSGKHKDNGFGGLDLAASFI